MSELEQLIRMANQIAANFQFHDNPAERIADHLRRFWAPSMRSLLRDFVARDGSGVHADVVAAVARLHQDIA